MAKQQQTRNTTFASLHWRDPKTNPQNLRTLTHTHHQLNIKRHLRQHPARRPNPKRKSSAHTHPSNCTSDNTWDDTLPNSPLQTNPKNQRTLSPILEVRTPITTAIWGTDNTQTKVARMVLTTDFNHPSTVTVWLWKMAKTNWGMGGNKKWEPPGRFSFHAQTIQRWERNTEPQTILHLDVKLAQEKNSDRFLE